MHLQNVTSALYCVELNEEKRDLLTDKANTIIIIIIPIKGISSATPAHCACSIMYRPTKFKFGISGYKLF